MYDLDNSPRISAFAGYNSAKPNKTVNMLKCLITNRYKDEVERYRASENNAIKASLPCMTISGLFDHRSETGLIEHSGYICLDIDGKDQNKENIDWEDMKTLIGTTFDCVYFIGLSISGKGIYIVAKIRNPKYHKLQYRALAKEVSRVTGLKIDMSCCDIARLRGVSYDSTPYYNPNPTMYNMVLVSKQGKAKTPSKSEAEMTKQNVEEAIKLIGTHKIDITQKYKAWLKIGVALVDGFGKEGRKLFHLISCFYESYNEEDCDKMYDKCENWGTEIRIETFFYYCKLHGIVRRKGGMVYDPDIIQKNEITTNRDFNHERTYSS
jgi:hypothetical protein